MTKRRNFLKQSIGLGLLGIHPLKGKVNSFGTLPIAANSYNWHTFYHREGKKWGENWKENIKHFAQSGIKAFEPSLTSLKQTSEVINALKEHDISMPSVYVNSVLHEKKEAQNSINQILELALLAKSYGTKIIVTNPSPIKWGGPDNKSDDQLKEQAKNLNELGRKLREMDLVLAYHTHDVELRAGAREFHHMLQNTHPENMSFCFDVHWVFRGSENSQLAVFDVLKMYGDRIAELHLRQSTNGVWDETFGSGDIDYMRFAKTLKNMKVMPHLVIEQCVERGSPHTMDVVEAHKKDLARVNELFLS